MKLAILCLCLASTASAAPVSGQKNKMGKVWSLGAGKFLLSFYATFCLIWLLFSFHHLTFHFVVILFSRPFITHLITQEPDHRYMHHSHSVIFLQCKNWIIYFAAENVSLWYRYKAVQKYYCWTSCLTTIMIVFMSFQAKNPFSAGQPLAQAALTGAYSVELVCHSFLLHMRFSFYETLLW